MHKLNQILSTVAFCGSLFFMSNTCDAMVRQINPSKVHVSHQQGQVDLFHGLKDFFVKKEGKVSKVERYFVDKKIRKINTEKLKGFLRHNYLTVNQMSDGEYSVKAHVRGLGGGLAGASVGAQVGKGAAYVFFIVGAGIVTSPVELVGGPGAHTVAAAALLATYSVPIEAATNVVAVAGGLLGAIFTGPV